MRAITLDEIRLKPIEWQGPFKPGVASKYDHLVAFTSLGEFRIEWKSWKENDFPELTLDGEYICMASCVESAKQLARRYILDFISTKIKPLLENHDNEHNHPSGS